MSDVFMSEMFRVVARARENMRHPTVERSTHPFPPTNKELVISQGLVESIYIYVKLWLEEEL